MSEKNARRKRLEKQAQGAQPPPQAAQPVGAPTATVADLLQLLGAKDVEILGLQRQVAGLERQVQMLAEQLAKKKEKKGQS